MKLIFEKKNVMSMINGGKRYIYNEKIHEREELLFIFPDSYIKKKNAYKEINTKEIICDFVLKDKIGQGSYGIVKIGENKQTGEKVAIKIYEKDKLKISKNSKMLEREINILKIIKHPNIVRLISVIETEHQIFIITEYIKGVELSRYLFINKKMNEKEACSYFGQIISGLEYLHSMGISHRDIKTDNIIIEQNTKQIKIIDFGFSNNFKKPIDSLLSTKCGSPYFCAPEMLDGQMYKGGKVDIWSAGVVLYIMLVGKLPFFDETKIGLCEKIIKGNYQIPRNCNLSDNAKDLISKILCVNPNKRINIKKIKNHPWMNNIKDKMNKGLNINKYIIPIDEEIIYELEKNYNLSGSNVKNAILYNVINDKTTLYYLMLQKKIRENKESVADLKSDAFISYINDERNLLSNHRKNNSININLMKKFEKENEKEINNISKGRFESNTFDIVSWDKHNINNVAYYDYSKNKNEKKVEITDKINEFNIKTYRKTNKKKSMMKCHSIDMKSKQQSIKNLENLVHIREKLNFEKASKTNISRVKSKIRSSYTPIKINRRFCRNDNIKYNLNERRAKSALNINFNTKINYFNNINNNQINLNLSFFEK